MYICDCFNGCVRRARLGACLAEFIVFSCGLDNAAAFANRVTDRLLDKHILARLQGPNRNQCMPMVRCGRSDDIYRLVFKHLSQILYVLGLAALNLGNFFGFFLPYIFVGIDDISHFGVFSTGKSF